MLVYLLPLLLLLRLPTLDLTAKHSVRGRSLSADLRAANLILREPEERNQTDLRPARETDFYKLVLSHGWPASILSRTSYACAYRAVRGLTPFNLFCTKVTACIMVDFEIYTFKM